jgi:RNA polymerase sigma-70 factor (ECF subfamily)
VKKYEEAIRRYVKRLGCKDESDVDDVLQEIFIKVFVNLNDYDLDLKFSSWLYRIAHNETISSFRKRSVRPSVLNTEDVEGIFEHLADETDFVELAHQRYDSKIVQSALFEISPKYKEVFLKKKAILK